MCQANSSQIGKFPYGLVRALRRCRLQFESCCRWQGFFQQVFFLGKMQTKIIQALDFRQSLFSRWKIQKQDDGSSAVQVEGWGVLYKKKRKRKDCEDIKIKNLIGGGGHLSPCLISEMKFSSFTYFTSSPPLASTSASSCIPCCAPPGERHCWLQ